MFKHNEEMKKVLTYTNESLRSIRENIAKVYQSEDLNTVHQISLGQAFRLIEEWREWYSSVEETHNTEINNLIQQNIKLRTLNGRLKMENEELKNDLSSAQIELGSLRERVNLTEEVIAFKDEAMNNTANTLDSKLFEVSGQLAEVLDMIKENSSKIVQTNKVKAGISTPAKRIDVSDEKLKELYESGLTPYKIGKKLNMTQQAIIYRLKQMNVYKKDGGKNNEEEQ